ncbi:DUF6074 family protein [Neorhizobium sp. P12A]|uniref:DUF6074 family protein n=1 Tax=Neorhizobium sp. P12A TaxID=2268027 RepID=UPI0010D446A3|nr:hypothetical protein EV561_105217 [Rhizobium sp. BK376]
MLTFFPLHRRRQEVIRCADALDAIHGEAANAFWKAEMRSLAGLLKAAGADDAEISSQIFEFNAAVQEELQSRSLAALHLAPQAG